MGANEVKPASLDQAAVKESVRRYWEAHPNALLTAGSAPPDSREFFESIEAYRYRMEPSIAEMAEFDRFPGRSVLEVGCGVGTDLRQFAKAGSRVVGLDLTLAGVFMARTAFERFGLQGRFVVGDAEALPFRDGAFDLVYSNGVIHHTPDTERAVDEIHRVLRQSGEARVMVYHANSFFATVMVGWVFRPLVWLLLRLFPGGRLPCLIEQWFPPTIREMHRTLAATGYSWDRLLALSTDRSQHGEGNFNPLSRCYSVAAARRLFSKFHDPQTFVRHLTHARVLPGPLFQWVERRWGWFLFVRARKAAAASANEN